MESHPSQKQRKEPTLFFGHSAFCAARDRIWMRQMVWNAVLRKQRQGWAPTLWLVNDVVSQKKSRTGGAFAKYIVMARDAVTIRRK